MLKKIIIIMIVVAVGWYGNYKFGRHNTGWQATASEDVMNPGESSNVELTSGADHFKCDGRTYCSQMTSCEEAKFFIKNCPNTKMDGNNDGIPCEKQWCK